MNEKRPDRLYLQFQNQMSRWETVLLLLYLPIHVFLMPAMLEILFRKAGISYTMMQLNVCYYAVSTAIVFLLSHRFLRRNFDVLCDRLWGVLFTVVIAYFLQQALMYLVAIIELPFGISGDNQNNSAVRSAAGGIVGSGGCTVSGCTSTTANLSAEWTVHKKTSDYSYCKSDAMKAAG